MVLDFKARGFLLVDIPCSWLGLESSFSWARTLAYPRCFLMTSANWSLFRDCHFARLEQYGAESNCWAVSLQPLRKLQALVAWFE